MTKRAYFLILLLPLLFFCFDCTQEGSQNPPGTNNPPGGSNPNANGLAAFPGAEGFGAQATGGRGTDAQVIYVTNLNSDGPGSFQAALDTPGRRFILFKVSGVIDGTGRINEGDVTIAGQTSPGGILIRGMVCDNVFDPNHCNNVILRHVRSRPGSGGNANDDALRIEGAQNVIIDHVSLAQATDETIQISRSQNVTIQNTILAEPLGEHFPFGGMLINYSSTEFPLNHLSIHHNIWTRVGGRMPEISCEENGAEMGLHSNCTDHRLELELSDNLLFDPAIEIWYNRCTGNNEGNDCPLNGNSQYVDLNWVNNRMVARSGFDNEMLSADLSQNSLNVMFFSGNQAQRGPAVSDYNPVGAASRSARHDFPGITYDPADQVVAYIQNNAGAFPRDPMDQRLLGYLSTNLDSLTPALGGVSADTYLLNFDPANPPSPPPDTDNDGMPDDWEVAHGLNLNAQDHNGAELSLQITGVEGYTNLECYLNELAEQMVGH